MATLVSVLADIATLSASDKEILKSHIIKAFSKHSPSLEAFIKDERFSGGLVPDMRIHSCCSERTP